MLVTLSENIVRCMSCICSLVEVNNVVSVCGVQLGQLYLSHNHSGPFIHSVFSEIILPALPRVCKSAGWDNISISSHSITLLSTLSCYVQICFYDLVVLIKYKKIQTPRSPLKRDSSVFGLTRAIAKL